MSTIVLDSGAFIAAEHWSQKLEMWLAIAADENSTLLVPAAVVAEIWRRPPRARSAALIASVDQVVPLDADWARDVGVLLGIAGSTQIVDASVALVAIAHQPSFVLTSDAADIEALVTAAGVDGRIGLRTHAPVQIIEI